MPCIERGKNNPNLRVSEHCPEESIGRAAGAMKYEQYCQKKGEQLNNFIQNEKAAKKLVDKIPTGSVFTVSKRIEDEVVTYPVTIKSITDKSVVFGPPEVNNNETRSFMAFCLTTQLMIRDSKGNPIENKNLTEKLRQTYTDLPQTRTTAA